MADIAIANSGLGPAVAGFELANSLIGRGRHSALRLPSLSSPPANGSLIDACALAPFHRASLPPIDRQDVIVGAVPLLLNGRRPSTIRRLVMPVIVNPVDARTRRPAAHVGQEVGEVQPAVTDANASAAVAGILRVVRIETSPLHVHPDHVGPAARSRLRVPVRSVARRRGRAVQTAARPRVAAYQASGVHRRPLSAGALTHPRAASGGLVDMDGGQATERLTGQIVNLRHAIEYAVFPLWRQ